MSQCGIKDMSALSRWGAGFHVVRANYELVLGSQERNLDWFPRMRAMSLVSSDSEGEQNELRNLQEKLESTMKLVTNLSGQLSELKDQVRASRAGSQPAVARPRAAQLLQACSTKWVFTAPWTL